MTIVRQDSFLKDLAQRRADAYDQLIAVEKEHKTAIILNIKDAEEALAFAVELLGVNNTIAQKLSPARISLRAIIEELEREPPAQG